MSHSCKSRNCETPHYEDDEANFQSAYDSITEIKCSIGSLFDCWKWMDRTELKDHLTMHSHYKQDVEHYWNEEAERRYEAGPYWTPYTKSNRYAA